MAVVKASNSDVKLLARLMRAEAVGDGTEAMLDVGNVLINRVRVDCSDFKHVRTIPGAVYQPHAFSATLYGFFYQHAKKKEERLAKKVINGYRRWPAKYSLWYLNPYAPCSPTWYGQPIAGKWKNHCFYQPTGKTCTQVYYLY